MVNPSPYVPKSDLGSVFVKEGFLIVKSQFDRTMRELKFVYILGPMNVDKIKTAMPKEELRKIIGKMGDKDSLYGNVSVI